MDKRKQASQDCLLINPKASGIKWYLVRAYSDAPMVSEVPLWIEGADFETRRRNQPE